jgi:hypothetical protein
MMAAREDKVEAKALSLESQLTTHCRRSRFRIADPKAAIERCKGKR